MDDTDAKMRQYRLDRFAVRAEPTREPQFEGEKTFYTTYNGRQEYPTNLTPAEARKWFELLRTEFNL